MLFYCKKITHVFFFAIPRTTYLENVCSAAVLAMMDMDMQCGFVVDCLYCDPVRVAENITQPTQRLRVRPTFLVLPNLTQRPPSLCSPGPSIAMASTLPSHSPLPIPVVAIVVDSSITLASEWRHILRAYFPHLLGRLAGTMPAPLAVTFPSFLSS